MAVASHVGDQCALLRDVPFALRDVPFGHVEMLLHQLAFHARQLIPGKGKVGVAPWGRLGERG